MRRATTLALAALTLLVLAAQASAATRPTAAAAATYGVRIDVPVKKAGLAAELDGAGSALTLRISNRSQSNEYTVPARISAAGVEARFGRLGRVSLDFEPARAHSRAAAPAGCRGGFGKTEGIFEGIVQFRGERDYVRIDSRRLRGQLETLPGDNCARHAATPAPRRATDHDDRLDRLEQEAGRKPLAVVVAGEGHRLVAAYAIEGTDGSTAAIFFASKLEVRGRMLVNHLAGARAPASAFVFDKAAGTAMVAPPKPFTGSAYLGRFRNGTETWLGALRVSLLGVDPIRLAGPQLEAEFGTKLLHEG